MYDISTWWVCYCGEVSRWSWSFPHWDCQGGRKLNQAELLFWIHGKRP